MRLKIIAFLLTSLLFFPLLFLGCKEDSKPNDIDILGRWKVFEALRNNQPTTTLQNAYFEFVNDSLMRTNILGTEVESTFEYGPQNRSIRQFSNPLIEYQIREVTSDSMKLGAKIKEYSFQFFLVKE